MKLTAIALAAGLLVTGGAASAQSATDARCIMLSNIFAQQAKEPNSQKAAEASLYFYLGRIGPNATTAQMKALFEAQAKTITQANAGTLMGDCAKAVQTKVDLLQTLAAQQPAAKPAPAQPPKK
jgi:hypothetical protein